jgi:protein tyrosine phosphatase (PTP) superfamily phosphohydrolase (DUF442 family)
VRHKKFLLSTIIATGVLIVAVATILFGSTSSESMSDAPQPKQPEVSSGELAATLPLFHPVDENYFRGSQPQHGGIGTLTRLGVKTLVDLRSIYDHTDDVRTAAESAGLGYRWIPMSVWTPPTDDDTNKFVALVTDTAKGPFFVFCGDGLNRTGEMTAIYRVAHDHWSVEKALDEADEIGFNPYYYTLRNYVWDYARKFHPLAVPREGRRSVATESL